MAPEHVQKAYEEYGRTDPFYAVLSVAGKERDRGGWEPDEFFATGREEIEDALAHVRGHGVEVRTGRALDFGCGVGRLTQALGRGFDEVVGVDVSSSMVENARRYNACGERCRYVVNTRDDLALFPDAEFDFVYSNICLQHNPPRVALGYVAEFFRVLRPGGAALFQLPSGARHEPGSLGEALYAFRHGPLRRWWKWVRGRPPVEMHYVHHSLVEEAIECAGGRLVEASPYGSIHRGRVSLRYCAVRAAAAEENAGAGGAR